MFYDVHPVGFYHHLGNGEKLWWWQCVWWCWICLVFTCPLPLEWLEGTSPDSSHPGRVPEIKKMRTKSPPGRDHEEYADEYEDCSWGWMMMSDICLRIHAIRIWGWEQVWRWGWGWCLRALGSWGCVGVPVAVRRVVAIGQGALKQETLKDKINWGSESTHRRCMTIRPLLISVPMKQISAKRHPSMIYEHDCAW